MRRILSILICDRYIVNIMNSNGTEQLSQHTHTHTQTLNVCFLSRSSRKSHNDKTTRYTQIEAADTEMYWNLGARIFHIARMLHYKKKSLLRSRHQFLSNSTDRIRLWILVNCSSGQFSVGCRPFSGFEFSYSRSSRHSVNLMLK